MALTFEQILQAPDNPIIEVSVPEWRTGGDDVVRLQYPDSMEEYELQKRIIILDDEREKATSEPHKTHCQYREMVEWVAACLVDSSGRHCSPQDVEALARKSVVALTRCYSRIMQERKTLLNAMEAELKNAGPIGSGDSGPASPSTADTSTPT